MKENLLDVLMYLFENYFEDEVSLGPEQESVKMQLVEDGFPEAVITRAFDWLEGLAVPSDGTMDGDTPGAIRHFTFEEQSRIDVECRGFLLFLEQMGVLTAPDRELVIDRIMALDGEEVDLDQVKWVVQMVLFNQPDKDTATEWMEDLVFDEVVGYLH